MTDTQRLADLEAAFAEAGGRGVDMAEEIDALRADLAGQEDRERAAEARIGGNEYRRLIVLGRARGELLDRYAREDAKALLTGESYLVHHYHDVWHWADTTGKRHTTPANVSGPDYHASRRNFTTTLPESAFDWPIYRAATLSPATILSALRTAEAEYNVVFEDKAARGRFLEGMSIAQRIYRGAMNALADGRSVDG